MTPAESPDYSPEDAKICLLASMENEWTFKKNFFFKMIYVTVCAHTMFCIDVLLFCIIIWRRKFQVSSYKFQVPGIH